MFSFHAVRRVAVLAGLFLIATSSMACGAILEPTGLQDGHLLPKNTAEFRLGFSYASHLPTPFQKNDLDRRVAEVPSLTLNLGLGKRVEGQLHYAFLYRREKGMGPAWGSGDLTVAFKVALLREKPTLPAIALRLAAKLPNANREYDFGTDQTDFLIDALAAKTWRRISLFASLGFGILGNPDTTAEGGQDDLLRYGVGMEIPLSNEGTAFLISAEGQAFGRNYNYNERGAVRAGIRQPLGRVILDFGGSLGYVSESEDWSVRTGLTLPFSLPFYR